KALLQPHEDPVRHQLKHDRLVTLVRVPTRKSADHPTANDIALPVRLCLDSADANIDWHECQQVDSGMITPVFKNVWCHERGCLRSFAAGETAVGVTSEKAVRIRIIPGTRAAKDPFDSLCRQACDNLRVDSSPCGVP